MIRKFRIFMVMYWAMMLCFSGMYSMYIIEIGFTKAQVGLAVTIFVVSAFFGQNVMSHLADRYRNIKAILLIALFIGMAISLLLMLSQEVWFVCMLIALWGFSIRGSITLSELWFMRVLKSGNNLSAFGRIRGFGSIGYGMWGLITGMIIGKLGWGIYPYWTFMTVCMAIASVLLVRNISSNITMENLHGRDKRSFREMLKLISGIKELKRILVVMFLYSFAVSGIYSYLAVLISDFGGGALALGATYLFDASPEIVTFFLTQKLMARYGSKKLIATAIILQIIRLIMISFFNTPTSVMMLGILSGFAFGLVATSYKTYIYELIPEKYKAGGMGFCESMIGTAWIISGPVFGFVIMRFGVVAAVVSALFINFCAMFIILLSRDRKTGFIRN